jgi:hypothetical protein
MNGTQHNPIYTTTKRHTTRQWNPHTTQRNVLHPPSIYGHATVLSIYLHASLLKQACIVVVRRGL